MSSQNRYRILFDKLKVLKVNKSSYIHVFDSYGADESLLFETCVQYIEVYNK